MDRLVFGEKGFRGRGTTKGPMISSFVGSGPGHLPKGGGGPNTVGGDAAQKVRAPGAAGRVQAGSGLTCLISP